MAVLLQIDAWDPVAGATVTLRAASHDDCRICGLNGQTWWPVLSKLPSLQYDLFDGSFAAAIEAPTTSLSLITDPWPLFGRFAFADARVQMWTGELGDAWANWTLRLDGRVSTQPQIQDCSASFSITANDAWLDVPLLATYAGTTGAEGSVDLTGTAKPLVLGSPRFIPGVLIDSVNNVFQLHGYGALPAVTAVLDELVRYSPSVGDYATYDALVTASIPPGRYATALAVGMVRLGAPPAGKMSFIVSSAAMTAGQMIRQIALLSGGAGKIADASLAALDAARPWPLSIYVGDQTTARALIQSIAQSVNATAGVSWLGQLFTAPVQIGNPTIELHADGSAVPPVSTVSQANNDAPWWRLAIGAERCWNVHSLTDIAFEAPLTPRGQWSADTVYREGDIVTLTDGSEYLYISTTPAKGNALPVAPATETDWWQQIQGATTAADLKYGDGQTIEDLKPAQPGADVTGDNTAKDTSSVGGMPAQQVVEHIGDLLTNVSDLQDSLGSSQSAAAAAQQAAGSASAAQQYSATAQTAATNAGNANAAAQGAVTAAQAARDTALSYQSGAQSARDAAQTASTNASGSAGTAAAQAALAVGANSSAQAAAASMFPERLDGTGNNFTHSYSGTPSAVPSIPASQYVADGSYGTTLGISLSVASPQYVDTGTVQVVPVVSGRAYKVEAEFDVTAVAAGDTVHLGLLAVGLDGTYTYISTAPTIAQSNYTTTGVNTLSGIVAFGTAPGTVDVVMPIATNQWMRPIARFYSTLGTTSVVRLRRLKITDVTSQVASAASAGAASTSATNASASATTASQQATIATQQATTATTKAGDASTYANNAASSAITAQGAATTATTQAGIATTAKGDAQTAAGAAQTSATAAAGSASTASSKADAASASATSAESSATTATTQAGSAQTYASNASTSATNAAGSATSAATQAGVSATNAAKAASAQTAAQVAAASTFPDRFDGNGDNWIAAYSGNPTTSAPLTTSNYVSVAGYGTVYQVTGITPYMDVGFRQVVPYVAGRVYQLDIEINVVSIASGATLTMANYVVGLNSSYAYQGEGVSASTAITATGVQTISKTIGFNVAGPNANWTTATATDVYARFFARFSSTVAGSVVQYRRMKLTDITSQFAAANSASAAATSASNAAVSATNAGTSATSAANSATTATTQATNAAGSASNAQTYANNASASASNAQGYSNTASTQAGAASNSATAAAGSATAAAGSATTASTQASNAANSASAASASSVSASSSAGAAALTAAQTLPTDFTQQGQYWFAGFQGAPSAALNTAVSSAVTFTSVAGLGPVALVSPAVGANVDTSMAGVLTVAPGRTYKLTVTYQGKTATAGLTINPYIIGLNATYAYVAAGSGSIAAAVTDSSLHTISVQISGDTVIAAGCNSIRALLRVGISAAGTAGGSAYLVSGVLEDVTASTQAGASATAAATSASNASASANAAAGSATSASGSANTASTQAGNAASSATAAAGSAANSSTSAAAAASSATLAASVGASSLNKNPVFGSWSGTYPDSWTLWSGNAPTQAAGATSPNAVRMAVAANASQGLLQVISSLTAVNTGDWIVFEADIVLNSGTLIGAGLYMEGKSGAAQLAFATDKDTTDTVQGNGVAGTSYSFRKLVQMAAASVTSNTFYMMNHWTGIGAITAANDITWLKASVRFATQPEIAAQRADANASNALAQVSSEASTRAAADGALSSRIDSVSAFVNVNQNMLQNPTGMNGMNGWVSAGTNLDGVRGSNGEGYFFHLGSGAGHNTLPGIYQDVPANAGNVVSLSGWIFAGGLTSNGFVRLYLEFLNSAGAHLAYQNGGDVSATQIVGGTGWTFVKVQGQTAPAGTAIVRVHCDLGSTGSWSNNNAAWRQIKLEGGPLCTVYTDDGTAAQLAASVTTQAGAIASLQGKTQAYWQTTVNAGPGQAFIAATALDQNGNATSSVGIGATNFAVYNPASGGYIKALEVENGNITITGDFYGGAGKMVWSNGSVMKVQGTGFGTTNQFIEWFGPAMDISQCWEGNATYYLRTDGSAYFGGALSAGAPTTKAATTDTGANAVAETNVFGSHGETITVTLSYTGAYQQRATYTPSQGSSFDAAASAVGATSTDGSTYRASGSDPGGFSVDLYRSINGSAYAKVATLTGSGSWSWIGQRPNGQDPGSVNINDAQGGSLTYTDPDRVAQDRQYKAVLTSRNPKYGPAGQQISIVTVEQ